MIGKFRRGGVECFESLIFLRKSLCVNRRCRDDQPSDDTEEKETLVEQFAALHGFLALCDLLGIPRLFNFSTPTQFLVERSIVTVTCDFDQLKARFGPSDRHAVARLQPSEHLTIDHHGGRVVRAQGPPFRRARSDESTTGRTVNVCGLMAEITNACKSLRTIGPPADKLCAVEPTGVLTIKPSQLYVVANSPSM